MSRTLILWIGALVLGLQAWFCIPRSAHKIETDLITRSTAALTAVHIPASGLSFNGREALLTGNEGSPEISDRAAQIVKSVYGVRTVTTRVLALTTGAPIAASGPATPAAVEGALASVLKLRNIEFDKGKADLTPVGRQTLDEVTAVLATSPRLAVEIQGHTDVKGIASHNRELSSQRAESVKQYLVAKGIDASRMTTKGFGQTRPIASNLTEEGRRANRRIEFHVKEAQ
jgi:outer membrane protein OmpA-like peptidoglycan-associated protein